MGIFDKFKTSTAIDRLSEEKLYEQVAQELKAGKKREGIWVKAMAKTGGDLNKAEALYIELRVQAIKDEASLAKAQNKLKEELKEQKRIANEPTFKNAIQKVKGSGYSVEKVFLEDIYTVSVKTHRSKLKYVYQTSNLQALHNWLDVNINK